MQYRFTRSWMYFHELSTTSGPRKVVSRKSRSATPSSPTW